MGAVSGAVDRIEGSVVSGWACCIDGGESHVDRIGGAAITVLSADSVIGSGVTTVPRPDVGGEFGFNVTCNAPLDPLLVLGGRVRVMARVGNESGELAITPSATSRLVAQLISATMRDCTADEMDYVQAALGRLPKAHNAEHIASRSTPEKQQALQLLERAGRRFGNSITVAELTSVPIEVGFVSPDGSALFGYDGEIYLIGGGNRLLQQFLTAPNDPEVERLAGAWRAIIVERARVIKAKGSRFLQVIIPEKLSVYPQRFPASIPSPSPILACLQVSLAASDVSACVLSGLRETLSVLLPNEIFPRLDSHLTVRATYALFDAQLRQMGVANPFPLELSTRQLFVGDLAERFFGIPLYEEYDMPGQAFVDQISGSHELVVEESVTGHIGTRFVWRNVAAPIDLKVVAFANSFFGRAGNARALSWWCSRAFREFHFIWTPALDMGYVSREQPDWVICQTIERFLPMLPTDVP